MAVSTHPRPFLQDCAGDVGSPGPLLCLPPNAPTQGQAQVKGSDMARAPNYGQERKERDRQKAAKKAEKQAAKVAAKERTKPEDKAEAEVETAK